MGKRILIIISCMKFGGGAQKIAFNLGKKLSEKNNEVKFLTFYDFYPKFNLKNEFCLNENLNSSKFFKLFKRAKKIAEICKKERIDTVVSFMEESNFPTILSRFFKNKCKILVSVHQSPHIYENFIYQNLIKILYPKSDYIVTISKEMERILQEKYMIKSKKIIMIYNCHEISKYQELSNEPLEEKYRKIFENSFVFINIGRLTEQKGQWFLIRSFKKVVEKYSNAKLIILGGGELKNNLQELINKLNLQNNVYLLGLQKNPYKFLKHSDCFVFPSLWEGLPNTLIEALSLNLPIISSDCKTGPKDILCSEINIDSKIDYPYYGKYGILTKPFPREMCFKSLDEKPLIEEEKMLADLMIKMVEGVELRKRYSNGLERAKDFDIEKIIKEWERIIKNT